MEQACSQRRGNLGIHALSARRLPEYCDSVWIAAKPPDVPMNPFKRKLLIHQPVVAVEMAFGIYRGVRKESQVTQTVVNCDDDHPFFHQGRSVVRITAPKLKSAAVNPYHHWPTTTFVLIEFCRRRIDIQEKAILAANPSRLRACTTELGRMEDTTGKQPIRIRRSPAARAHRGSRVGD